MKLRLCIIILLFACGSNLQAQYYFYNGEYYENDLIFEIGGSVGGMNCFTD